VTDPIDLLERLDAGRTPPAVEHVRRRGTQLRRRRTTVLTLAAAAAVAVVATGSVVALDRPDATTLPVTTPTSSPSSGPSSGPSGTPAPSATPTPPAGGNGVLGPDGYRDLRLGMTLAEARATGDLRLVDAPRSAVATGCAGFRLTDQPAGDKNSVDGYYSAAHGLAAVFARPGMSTPEGIGLGSTWAEVHQAYPHGRFNADHYWIVRTGPGTSYEFGIDHTRTVHELGLMLDAQDYFG